MSHLGVTYTMTNVFVEELGMCKVFECECSK